MFQTNRTELELFVVSVVVVVPLVIFQEVLFISYIPGIFLSDNLKS